MINRIADFISKILGIVTIIFVLAKIFNQITFSWFLVFMPLIVIPIIYFLIFVWDYLSDYLSDTP